MAACLLFLIVHSQALCTFKLLHDHCNTLTFVLLRCLDLDKMELKLSLFSSGNQKVHSNVFCIFLSLGSEKDSVSVDKDSGRSDIHIKETVKT